MSRQSFRHLKHKNMSISDDFMLSSGLIFIVPFFAARKAVAPLANDPIMSGDHYSCLDALNVKICALFQIL